MSTIDFADDMLAYAGTLKDELIAIRRDLHRHPELLYGVSRTAGVVADLLETWGIDVERSVGPHFGKGVTGTLRGEAGAGPTILLRADMDALPIREENDVPYRSLHEGVMHACGHDAHTAMLLGAARTLARFRGRIRGTVRFVFQPAEEGAAPSPLDGRLLSGGRDMIDAGVLEGVDRCFALHVMPELPAGMLGIHEHEAMAASSHFKIRFAGTPGHHSAPHRAVDALQMAAKFVVEANGLMANRVDPAEAAVLAFGTLQAGAAINVIAAHSELTGTFRAFAKETVDAITDGLRRMAASIADAAGGSFEMELREGMAVRNDAAAVSRVIAAASEILGEQQVVKLSSPSLAGEDFGWYLDQVPGAFAFIGCGNAAKGITHAIHQPRFDLDESILVQGARILAKLAVQP
ncbi:M20 metallopeptidase family protein [Paenibacillus chibensis]|uniref:M20 metallopeptidase family protein n=1 Tax=Paenibacillus chibensis TaxID=59846 RepID=UPI000FDA8BFA|nr:amidohydrolase [Paenibacillus chibensis]MEC0369358.1 amidohydrolase [Paenibacillus chibensis]